MTALIASAPILLVIILMIGFNKPAKTVLPTGWLLAVAPAVGALGSFMSGSNTVSNTLFASFQFQTALIVDLSPVLVVALQNIGGAAGNMICVNNVVAVCATTGTAGNEGKIIRTNILPCLFYCILAVVALSIIFH